MAPDSEILTDFPALFDEFRRKRFTLLWRGSRDGFGADDFHGRCDGHKNTLTLIQDTEGHIFGGFTPGAATACALRVRINRRAALGDCSSASPRPLNHWWRNSRIRGGTAFTAKARATAAKSAAH